MALFFFLSSFFYYQDVARLAVTRQIASMVQENYTALVGGMRQVQAVDLDLARAGVQVKGGLNLATRVEDVQRV